MRLDHLRAAAERAVRRILAGGMLAAGDDDAPLAHPLTLAELHALEPDGGTTLPELAAEAVVLDRLAGLTARLGSPWEAARHLFAPDAPCTALRATQRHEQGCSHREETLMPTQTGDAQGPEPATGPGISTALDRREHP